MQIYSKGNPTKFNLAYFLVNVFKTEAFYKCASTKLLARDLCHSCCNMSIVIASAVKVLNRFFCNFHFLKCSHGRTFEEGRCTKFVKAEEQEC